MFTGKAPIERETALRRENTFAAAMRQEPLIEQRLPVPVDHGSG